MRYHIATSKFYDNPLIKMMGVSPRWTVSTKNKAPLDMSYYLKTHQQRFASFKNKKHFPLVSLDAMKNDIGLLYANRAFRMNAKDDHIICIDIEPIADKRTTQCLLRLPAQYRELSMHNGYHLLLWVPDDLIKPNEKYIFNVTNIKGPTHNIYGKSRPKKTSHGIEMEPMFEFINNKHYVTLTRKMIPQMKVDLVHNKKQRKLVSKFLKDLTDYDKVTEQSRKKAAEVSSHTLDAPLKSIPAYVKQAGDRMLKMPEDYKSRDHALKLSDFDDDNSKYEFNVLMKIKKQFIYCLLSRFNILQLADNPKKPLDKYTWQDIDYVTYYVSTKILRPRTKHLKKRATKRDGLPWLLYEANKCTISPASMRHIEGIVKYNFKRDKAKRKFLPLLTNYVWPSMTIMKPLIHQMKAKHKNQRKTSKKDDKKASQKA